jgi:hypothetical protein
LISGPDLLEQFVASFEKLDEMAEFQEIDPVAWELRVGQPDQFGMTQWRPAKTKTDPELLAPVYARLPARFPPLYEQLVLSYRWAEVDLQSFRLLANPPGSDLSRLLAEVEGDKGLTESLIPAGYIKFGKGPDMDYDPVCFDLKSRTKRKDYRIVKIDHEEILCNYRVKVVAELAPSFEHLVRQTIERANAMSK